VRSLRHLPPNARIRISTQPNRNGERIADVLELGPIEGVVVGSGDAW
jgi:hypothetical protein